MPPHLVKAGVSLQAFMNLGQVPGGSTPGEGRLDGTLVRPAPFTTTPGPDFYTRLHPDKSQTLRLEQLHAMGYLVIRDPFEEPAEQGNLRVRLMTRDSSGRSTPEEVSGPPTVRDDPAVLEHCAGGGPPVRGC